MMIKKKEIIAAALVVLIGCAGYLNWSYQDTMTVTDGESYIETGRRLGEAQLVNSQTEVEEKNENDNNGGTQNDKKEEGTAEESGAEASDEARMTSNEENNVQIDEKQDSGGTYFETARYERENARSKSLEILNQTCANSSFDEETRRKAGDKIIAETNNINAEQEIESIAQSKGYSEVCAHISEESATVAVRKDGFAYEDAVVLSEIVQEQSGISANNIKIVEVKAQS